MAAEVFRRTVRRPTEARPTVVRSGGLTDNGRICQATAIDQMVRRNAGRFSSLEFNLQTGGKAEFGFDKQRTGAVRGSRSMREACFWRD